MCTGSARSTDSTREETKQKEHWMEVRREAFQAEDKRDRVRG